MEIHLDPIDKIEVYKEYILDEACLAYGVLSESRFNQIWTDVFPRVYIRQFKGVAGKCKECACFQNLMSLVKIGKD